MAGGVPDLPCARLAHGGSVAHSTVKTSFNPSYVRGTVAFEGKKSTLVLLLFASIACVLQYLGGKAGRGAGCGPKQRNQSNEINR